MIAHALLGLLIAVVSVAALVGLLWLVDWIAGRR